MCVFGKRWQFLIWRRESLLVETLPPNGMFSIFDFLSFQECDLIFYLVKHLRRAMDAAMESNTSSTSELEQEKEETTKKK